MCGRRTVEVQATEDRSTNTPEKGAAPPRQARASRPRIRHHLPPNKHSEYKPMKTPEKGAASRRARSQRFHAMGNRRNSRRTRPRRVRHLRTARPTVLLLGQATGDKNISNTNRDRGQGSFVGQDGHKRSDKGEGSRPEEYGLQPVGNWAGFSPRNSTTKTTDQRSICGESEPWGGAHDPPATTTTKTQPTTHYFLDSQARNCNNAISLAWRSMLGYVECPMWVHNPQRTSDGQTGLAGAAGS